MNGTLLNTYHRMPGCVQSWAASIHGYRLRHWRYGPETERLVAEVLERESWSGEQWKAWQLTKLAELLHRAATTVPYYRNYWSSRRQKGDRASWEQIENWPVLEKEPLRSQPRAFVADDCDIRSMYCDETSGTTGTPIPLWESRKTVRAWYALAEARWRRWYRVSLHDRWAILGGKLVVPQRQKTPPYWVWNSAFNQLYVSSYHLSQETIPVILDALKQYRIQYLLGYTSSLNALAQEALRQGSELPAMRVVTTNGEPVLAHQRTAITQAFGPVRETYGLCELCVAASECDAGQLHLWPEAGWVETFQGNSPTTPGSVGDLICTGLLNTDMPLIRYRIGDRGSLSITSACSCGRTLPILQSLEGRIDDVLYTADGRLLSPNTVDIVFQSDLPLKEAQIIQEDLTHVRVRYVPAPGFDDSTGKQISASLRARLGPVEISLEPLHHIPRGPNGKFKVVASKLKQPQSSLTEPCVRPPLQ